MTAAEVVDVCRRAESSAMGPAFLFWLAFVLRGYTDREGNLVAHAGITKKSNPHFPFADAVPSDVATAYFDFWFRAQCVLLPTPVNLVIGYIALVAGVDKAISILQKGLELDATGLMTSEIVTELSRRDAIPLAYRILALYCEDLSETTQKDIKLLLIKWLEFELDSTQRRTDMIKTALGYLR